MSIENATCVLIRCDDCLELLTSADETVLHFDTEADGMASSWAEGWTFTETKHICPDCMSARRAEVELLFPSKDCSVCGFKAGNDPLRAPTCHGGLACPRIREALL